jgi:hypothetical protein
VRHIAFSIYLMVAASTLVGCSPRSGSPDPAMQGSRELQSTVARPADLLQLNSLAILPLNFVEKERQHDLGDAPFYAELVESFVAESGVEVKRDPVLLKKGHGASRTPSVAEIQAIGRHAKVDGVLVPRILTFVERVGSRVGVTTPAQVGFSMSIVSVATGEEVWSSTYHVSDQAVLDNLFKLPQNVERGPRWRTAEEILTRGFALAARDFGVRRREQFTS